MGLRPNGSSREARLAAPRRDGFVEPGNALLAAIVESSYDAITATAPPVFDSYWQAKTDRRGVGAGLAIVKGIVEAHGGRIWIESTLGKGTKVSFDSGDVEKLASRSPGTRGAPPV